MLSKDLWRLGIAGFDVLFGCDMSASGCYRKAPAQNNWNEIKRHAQMWKILSTGRTVAGCKDCLDAWDHSMVTPSYSVKLCKHFYGYSYNPRNVEKQSNVSQVDHSKMWPSAKFSRFRQTQVPASTAVWCGGFTNGGEATLRNVKMHESAWTCGRWKLSPVKKSLLKFWTFCNILGVFVSHLEQ